MNVSVISLFFSRELLFTLSERELSALENALCSAEEPDKILSEPEQKDESSQVDPGFDEEAEPSTSSTLTEIARCLEQEVMQIADITSDLLTPDQEGLGVSDLLLEDYSPTNTLVDPLEGQESLNSSLNKSESRDSGLQSENVSTSETVMCDVSAVNISSDSTVVCMETQSSNSQLTNHDTQAFCRELVEGLISQAIPSPPYSRQNSGQQYNLNLEIPRISSVSSSPSSSSTSSHSTDSSVINCDKPPQTCLDQSQSHPSSDVHQSQSVLDNKDICDIASNTNHVIDANSMNKSSDLTEPCTSKIDSMPSAQNECENSEKDTTTADSSDKEKVHISGDPNSSESTRLREHPRIQRLRYTTDSVSSSFSSCHSNTYDAEWDKER